MPSWLIKLLVSLATQFGVPYLIEKFNWIPASFWEVVKEILKHVQEAPNKEEAIKSVRSALSCSGIGCAPELKGK
jgi:hypothetical protein